MPRTPHTERRGTASEAVRGVVIGVLDGVTAPFGAASSSGITVVAGLAELAWGSVSMGPGGCLGARRDAEFDASGRSPGWIP
jgi:hypothetical protein